MVLKVVVGKTIRLTAQFFSEDQAADPVGPRVDVVDPKGLKVVADALPVREGRGQYSYEFSVPLDATVGTWNLIWRATIKGKPLSEIDAFEVQNPEAADEPKPEPAEATVALQSPPASSRRPSGSTGSKRRRRFARPRRSSDEVSQTVSAPAMETEDPGAEKARATRRTRRSETRSRLSPFKTLLIVGVIAIILLGIWFTPRREDTVQATVEQGVAAHKAGRTDEARRLYEEALANDPDNKLANFNLGVAAQVAGQLDQAEAYYRKSLSSDPEFLPGLFNLAILLERQDRNGESAEIYQIIVENYPDNAPVHLNYGFLLAQKLDRVEEGKAEFRRAVELEPALANRIPPDWRPTSAASGPPAEP